MSVSCTVAGCNCNYAEEYGDPADWEYTDTIKPAPKPREKGWGRSMLERWLPKRKEVNPYVKFVEDNELLLDDLDCALAEVARLEEEVMDRMVEAGLT